MTWLAGVDGCRAGWFRICRSESSGELAFHVARSVAELLSLPPQPAVVALDMPIGLPASGPRACDREARARLGPRRSSVFPAPIRATLRGRTRTEAAEIAFRIDGRKISAQAWGIVAKIREVDTALAASPAARAAIREVHPELSFWAWNRGAPMRAAKRTPEGRAERLALAEHWLGAGILARARGTCTKAELADDDILDAVALLWTAHRIARGEAATLPASPPRDETGLPMQIVF